MGRENYLVLTLTYDRKNAFQPSFQYAEVLLGPVWSISSFRPPKNTL
jgi:hypothetical protein